VSDEYASLTIDEIQSALKEAGVFFDFIGMDCCIMSSLEVCCALYNYCDYTILSEDFESGLGWSYEGWIRALCTNTSIDTKALGKIICDDMVKANTNDTDAGDNAILAVVDQSMIKLLYSCWKEFAYSSETELKSQNYSRSMKPKHGGRVHPALVNAYGTSSNNGGKSRFGFISSLFGEDEASLSDYYEVDIMSAASSIDGEASDALKKAIANALVYVAYTSGDAHLTGLAVSLPYGDSEGYQSMQEIFSNVGMDDDYIEWLEQFVYIENSDNYYDYDSFDDTWYGWDSYEDQYDDDDISIWDIFFGDDYDDEYDDDYFDYGFDDMDYDDFYWNW